MAARVYAVLGRDFIYNPIYAGTCGTGRGDNEIIQVLV